jgi:hypothetical protein
VISASWVARITGMSHRPPAQTLSKAFIRSKQYPSAEEKE